LAYLSQSNKADPDTNNFKEKKNPFLDPHTRLSPSSVPPRPLEHKWKHLKTSFRPFIRGSPLNGEPFSIELQEISNVIGGDLNGVLVRAHASMTDYFYNKTEIAFGDTRIVAKKLKLRFVGGERMSFRPGLPFSAAIELFYDDFTQLSVEELNSGNLEILVRPVDVNGASVGHDIRFLIDPQEEEGTKTLLNSWVSIHHFIKKNSFACFKTTYIGEEEADEDALVEDEEDVESTQKWLNNLADQQKKAEFRAKGIHCFSLPEAPKNAQRLFLMAKFSSETLGEIRADSIAWTAINAKAFVKISTSSKKVIHFLNIFYQTLKHNMKFSPSMEATNEKKESF